MAPHLEWLSENWPGFLSVQPNAGLPELVDGQTRYPLQPGELAGWLERFIVEDGVNLIGGCCGTTTDHIAALDAMLRKKAGEEGQIRPAPAQRQSFWVPSVASLYSQVGLRQENAYLSVGERCNANGSKQVPRACRKKSDWDACVAMGVEQDPRGLACDRPLHGLRRTRRGRRDE